MIKFDEIIKNKEYRERVIKYFRLPMRLSISEEKFRSDLEFMRKIDEQQYLNLVMLTENDFNNECIKQSTNEPDFTMEDMLKPIVDKFEASPRWQAFIENDYSDTLKDYQGITTTHQFYIKENDGKKLLSIDLVSANWQSLQKVIGFDETYEELIVQYTDNLIPPMSKTVRTKITGLLNAKKIMDYNKKLLFDNKDNILEQIKNMTNIDLTNKEPFAFYADEFIMELTEDEFNKITSLDYEVIENIVYNKTKVNIHFRPFMLNWLDLEKSCVKNYRNGEYEVINLSKDILLLINKIQNDVEIEDIDFEKIKYEKQSFVEKIKNTITKINESKIY